MPDKIDYTRKCQQLDVLIDLLERENRRLRAGVITCDKCVAPKRGEEGIWASGERFTESGWYTYCDDHECRITHWKKQPTPKPPIVYRMDEVG